MRAIALAFFAMTIPASLQAGEITSVISVYRDSCKLTEKLDESGDEYYSCLSYGDIGIRILVGHDSNHLSFGPKAQDECAFRQRFIAYSTPTSEIEWRVQDDQAFATIQSWSMSKGAASDQGSDEWLVVTRLGTGKTCRVAAIQATLPDAIEQARASADKDASRFDCKRDLPKIIAATPIAQDELMTGAPCTTP